MSQEQAYAINVYTPDNGESTDVSEVVDFFYESLDQYGDTKESIRNSIDYALSREPNKGGYLIIARDEENKIAGAVILNITHMEGYHPPNYLVYIAVHKKHRGTGLGKTLVQKASDITEGGIALHVEQDNPARFLYEKVGYKNKYLEYRLSK